MEGNKDLAGKDQLAPEGAQSVCFVFTHLYSVAVSDSSCFVFTHLYSVAVSDSSCFV